MNKTMTLCAAGVLALCLGSGKAHAQSYVSGNDLFNICGDKKVVAEMACLGYISGMLTGIAYQTGYTYAAFEIVEQPLDTEYTSFLKHYCIPKGVKNRQIVKVIKKYMLDNPELLHIPSSSLVVKALTKAFPCYKISDTHE